MADNLRVSMRLDGDGKPLAVAIDGAEKKLDAMATAAVEAGAKASQGLGTAGKAADQARAKITAVEESLEGLGTAAADAGAKTSAGLGTTGKAADDAKRKVDAASAAMADAGAKAKAVGDGAREGAAGLNQAGAAAASAGQAAGGAAPHLGNAGKRAEEAGRGGRAAAEGLKQAGAAAGVTGRQMQQLTPQLNDIFTSLVGGMPLFMIAAQQGPQITQVFGGMRATASALAASARAAITPTNLLIGGGVALAATAATLALSAERQQRSLNALSGQLRATRTDYAGLASDASAVGRALGENSRFGTAESTEAAGAIAGTPQFSGNRAALEELVRLAGTLSVAYGITLPAAADRFVVKALKDPAAAARELAEGGMRTMTASLEEQVRKLAATGRAADATRLILDALNTNFAGAAEGGTVLERSINRIENALTRMWNAASKDNSFLSWLANGAAGFLEAGGRATEMRDQLRQQRQTSGITGSTGAIGRVDTAYRPYVETAARMAGVDVELLARVQGNEGRRQADGSWAVSRAGARGGMQVMPGTFAEMARKYGIAGGIDDDAANAQAGAYYMRELLDKYGDPRAAVAAYNAGPGRYDQSRTGRLLPAETIAYTARVTAGYGGSGLATAAPLVPPDGGALIPRASPNAGISAPRTEAQNVSLRAALAVARDIDPTAGDRRRLAEQQSQLQAARNLPGLSQEDAAALDAAIARVGATAAATRDPIEALIKGLRDTGEMAGVQEGPVRELAEAQEKLREAEEAARRPASDAERMAVQDAVLQSLSGRYRAVTADMDRQIASQDRLAAAHLQGSDAVRLAEAREKALEEARKHAEEGSPRYLAMVESLTARNLKLADSFSSVASQQALAEQGRTAEMTSLQRSLIGSGAADSATALAELRARQDLARGKRPTTGPEAEAYIRNARQQAVADLDLERQRSAFDELGNFASSSFDRISSSITTMALEGNRSFTDLKNVGSAVASELLSEFVKLSLINPLKNAAFGGNSATIGDVLGRWLGSSMAGGSTGFNPSVDVGVSSSGVVGGLYHTGGIVGREPTAHRVVPASLFAAAPRFHAGSGLSGLGAGEVPAILQAGETVLTPGQMAALGPAGGGVSMGGLTVNFNGTTGTADERRAMAQEVDMLIRQRLVQATPAIVEQARADAMAQAGNGGPYAYAMGRRR